MTGGLTDLKEQESIHQTLHEEEAHQEEQQQVAAPLQEQHEEQQEEQHEHLREEDFEVLDIPLAHADPVFWRQESSLFRQRNQVRTEGGKKARRKAAKQAAEAQNAQDERRKTEISAWLVSVAGEQDDTTVIIQSSLLRESMMLYQRLDERKDVNGEERRRNERRFSKTPRWDPIARSAAKADLDNLTNNLRRDICLEGDDTLPEVLSDCEAAYYFTNRFGNRTGEQMHDAMKADEDRLKAIRAGTVGTFETEEEKEQACRELEERIERTHEQKKKLDQFVLYQKSSASNFGVTAMGKLQNLRTLRLAKQQILDEGHSPYHMLMVSMLDEEIDMWQAEYDRDIQNILTCQNRLGTPRGQAQIAAQKELARIRRAMLVPGVTPEQLAALTEEGRNVFRNYNYEGVDQPVEPLGFPEESGVLRRW